MLFASWTEVRFLQRNKSLKQMPLDCCIVPDEVAGNSQAAGLSVQANSQIRFAGEEHINSIE